MLSKGVTLCAVLDAGDIAINKIDKILSSPGVHILEADKTGSSLTLTRITTNFNTGTG